MTLETLLRKTWATHPDRIAVESDRTLTYRELAQESETMARRLRALGVGREERVLHEIPRSADGIVGILGILLAGGAYVPVDPQTPPERRKKIIEDCRPIAILGAELQGQAREAIKTERRMDDLAAILYTSGSTGMPKGVCITDTNIAHFIEWMIREFEVTHDDRLSNHAPYHFDLSLFDYFAAFSVGATVVPVPEEHLSFPVKLAEFVARKTISVWYSVPFALIGLAERGGLSRFDFSHLRQVLFAGEVFPMGSLRKLADLWPQVRFANLYGPTETNVCTYFHVLKEDLQRDELPIGQSAPGFELELDDDELLVRGPGVMPGYWGEKALCGSAYRTGDRVESHDGLLWFRGRMDRMVKIRGHRVEPGEIEAAFHRHEDVEEAAVVAVPDLLGQNILCASVVLKNAEAKSGVLASIRSALPLYMIPAKLSVVTKLPRTSTGKVDYQKLQEERHGC